MKTLRLFIAVGLATYGLLTLGAWRADAHGADATITDSVCTENQTWSFTLTITEDVPGGVAKITVPASPYSVPVPYTHTFHVDDRTATWPLDITVSWPDGFVKTLPEIIAHRPPSGCVPATTVPPTTAPATTSTTSCSQAIPPRADCGGATTVPRSPSTTHLVTTVPTTVPASSSPTVPTTEAQRIVATTGCTSNCGPTGTLPTTGAGADVIAAGFVALGVVLVGGVLILVTRKRA